MTVCGEVAHECVCKRESGHQGPHLCEDDWCRGEWRGTLGEPDFEIVSLPVFGMFFGDQG